MNTPLKQVKVKCFKMTFWCREEMNSELEWLYTNDVCTYPVTQGGSTSKVR